MRYSVKNLIKVDRTTRAGNDGKLIFCPDCFHSKRVYHFAWAGIWCKNKECDYTYEKSPNKSISKNEWLIKK
jgi:hypothetical protein